MPLSVTAPVLVKPRVDPGVGGDDQVGRGGGECDGGNRGLRVGRSVHRLDVADVIGGLAEERVGIAGRAVVRVRGVGGVGQPGRWGRTVDRDIDRVAGQAGAAGVVLARPGDGEVRIGLGGGERGHGAGGRNGVDDVRGRVRFERGLVVEGDRRLVRDDRACRGAGQGLDGVGDVPLAVVVGVVGGQEPDTRVYRGLAGVGVEAGERPVHDPRRLVDPRVDLHQQVLPVWSKVDGRLEEASPRGDGDHLAAEGDLAELERPPVEIAGELVGDRHDLGRCRGRGVILEVDRVGHQRIGTDIANVAVAGGAGFVVGVVGDDDIGRSLVDNCNIRSIKLIQYCCPFVGLLFGYWRTGCPDRQTEADRVDAILKISRKLRIAMSLSNRRIVELQ